MNEQKVLVVMADGLGATGRDIAVDLGRDCLPIWHKPFATALAEHAQEALVHIFDP
jgi:hypothetical protein